MPLFNGGGFGGFGGGSGGSGGGSGGGGGTPAWQTKRPLHDTVLIADGGYGSSNTFFGITNPACQGLGVDGGRIFVLDHAPDQTKCGLWIMKDGAAWVRAVDWPVGMIPNSDFFFIDQGDYLGYGMRTTSQTPVGSTTNPSADWYSFNYIDIAQYNDISGFTFLPRIEKLRGNKPASLLKVWARRIIHEFPYVSNGPENAYGHDVPSPGISGFRKEYYFGTSVAGTAETHTFVAPTGAITAELKVTVCDSSGVSESHTIRETRNFDGSTTPTLIGSSVSTPQPSSPVSAVALVWGATSVSVSLTGTGATTTRFFGTLDVTELPKP